VIGGGRGGKSRVGAQPSLVTQRRKVAGAREAEAGDGRRDGHPVKKEFSFRHFFENGYTS